MSINPLKKSELLGATVAVLGFDGFLPLHHGSQGCTAFIKNILTQHFKEVIPMQTTAVYNISAIMGSYSEVVDAIKNVVDSSHPKGVALLTTSMTQLRGDELGIAISEFRNRYPEHNEMEIFVIPTEDFDNDAEKGFSKALSTIVKSIEFEDDTDNYVLIIGNFSLTLGDIDEIKYLVEGFGLDAVFMPDISETLGGINNFYYKLPTGGTKYQKKMKKPLVTLGIGYSTLEILKNFEDKNISTTLIPSLMGLKWTDEFFDLLYTISGRKPNKRVLNFRNRLIDTILDAHFYFSHVKVGVASEPDLLYAIYYFLKEELGINVVNCATTYKRKDLDELIPDYYVGDLYDFEKRAKDIDILITNTHGELISEKYDKYLYQIGFPVKNQIGYPLKKFVGYEGTLNFLIDIANFALKHTEERSYVYKNYKGVKYEDCILQ